MKRTSSILILVAAAAVFITFGVLLLSGGNRAEAQPAEVDISDLGFKPTGYMGDIGDIKFTSGWMDNERGACIKIDYSAANSSGKGWAGIYWQYPPGNWGDQPGKYLTGARDLKFWARGENGKESAEFMVGGIPGDSVTPALSTGEVNLTAKWTEYHIDLSNRDLSNVKGGFFWTSSREKNPNGCTIYLADIKYVYS